MNDHMSVESDPSDEQLLAGLAKGHDDMFEHLVQWEPGSHLNIIHLPTPSHLFLPISHIDPQPLLQTADDLRQSPIAFQLLSQAPHRHLHAPVVHPHLLPQFGQTHPSTHPPHHAPSAPPPADTPAASPPRSLPPSAPTPTPCSAISAFAPARCTPDTNSTDTSATAPAAAAPAPDPPRRSSLPPPTPAPACPAPTP